MTSLYTDAALLAVLTVSNIFLHAGIAKEPDARTLLMDEFFARDNFSLDILGAVDHIYK